MFNDDLGDGTTGLAPGTIVTITVPVLVDAAIPVSENGSELTNMATIDADNADAKDSSATVTPDIEETIDASTSKEFTPDSQIAGSADPIDLALSGQNTSNVPVDTLVVQDPADPTASPNPFDYLEITDLGAPTPPAGGDKVTTEVYIDPNWVDASSADLSQAEGVRYTFTDTDGSGIDPGASTDIHLTLAQRDNFPDPLPDDGFAVGNDVGTTVTRGTDSAGAQADDTFQVRGSEIAVDAAKSIDPDAINAGDPATVTLTGTNTTPDDAPTSMTSMTITEPDANANNPFEGPNAVTFTGFGDVVWPTGATSATITYECAGTPATSQPTTIVNNLPDPPAGCDPVTGFTVTFEGDEIVPGATATIPFTVDTPRTSPPTPSPA